MNFNSFQTGQSCNLEQAVKEAQELVSRCTIAESVVATDTLFIVHWKTPTGYKGNGNPCSLHVINALFGRDDLQPNSVWYDASNTKHWLVSTEQKTI